MAILNSGDLPGLFERAVTQPTNNSLLYSQVDPTQPQVAGLTTITDPIIPANHSSQIVRNFDPDLYDLKPNSHLMRFIKALASAAGVAGIRKQQFFSRSSASINTTNFYDLDHVFGAMFDFQRSMEEQMPTNYDGTTINPYTDVTDVFKWDDVHARDTRYRARIGQLLRAASMGGTYYGLKGIAEAILNSEVDLVESWIAADQLDLGSNIIPPTGMTYGAIKAQKVTWGGIRSTYGTLGGNEFGSGVGLPGNRGELIFSPRRRITAEENYQLMHALYVVKPSGTQITIADAINQTYRTVAIKGVAADSENWRIQIRVTPALNLVQPIVPLYNNSGPYAEARPAFSQYEGESWSYIPNVIKTISYSTQGDLPLVEGDDELINYQDGVSHVYQASDGVMDSHQAISSRLSGDGVVTSFPYPTARTSTSSRIIQ